jgi:hypothetical protein
VRDGGTADVDIEGAVMKDGTVGVRERQVDARVRARASTTFAVVAIAAALGGLQAKPRPTLDDHLSRLRPLRRQV